MNKYRPMYLVTGELSSYGFACGYVEVHNSWVNIDHYAKMYRENNSYRVYEMDRGFHIFDKWFDTIGEARKEYRLAIRRIRSADRIGKY